MKKQLFFSIVAFILFYSSVHNLNAALKIIDAGDTLIFDLTHARVVEGLVQVPVSIMSNDPVQSFDFAFRLDETKLAYHSVISHKSNVYPSANYDVGDSTLRGTAFSVQDMDNNTPLISIRFSLLSGHLSISDLYRTKAWLNGINCSIKLIGNLCAGETVLLAPREENAINWLWSTGATSSSILVNTQGTYSCRTYIAGGGFIVSPKYQLIVRPLPVVNIIEESPATFCEGDSALLTANSSSGNIFLWTNGAVTQSTYVHEQGEYYVNVTDTNGCSAVSAPVLITVLPAPDASLATNGPTIFCDGDSVVLSAAPVPGNTYLWSTGSISDSVIIKVTGDYAVTVTAGNGCTASSDTISITVNPRPDANIYASGPTSLCPGDSVNLTASSGFGYIYLWSTGETTQTITIDSTGIYNVNVTDNNGCSAISGGVTVNVGYLTEDININGIVDGSDYLLLIGKFGLNCTSCPEDINLDGVVDGFDYLMLIGRFGASCG